MRQKKTDFCARHGSELMKEIEVGHYCRICDRERPNEQFSGNGHKIHVCKRCSVKPKCERQAIEDTNEILGFLQQSHISQRNVTRLGKMTKSDNVEVASLAAVVLSIAKVTPYRRRRFRLLAKVHPDLLRVLKDSGGGYDSVEIKNTEFPPEAVPARL